MKLSGFFYGLIVYLGFSAPAFYVHALYYLENRQQTIEINPGGVILYHVGKEVVKYSSQELLKVVLYKPATMDKESFGFQVTPFESYNYARIIPITGKEIVFTCLLHPDVEEAIKGIGEVSIERKRGLFFSIERGTGLPSPQ